MQSCQTKLVRLHYDGAPVIHFALAILITVANVSLSPDHRKDGFSAHSPNNRLRLQTPNRNEQHNCIQQKGRNVQWNGE